MFFPPELAVQSEMDGMESRHIGAQAEHLRNLYLQRARATQGDTTLDREVVRLVLEHAKRVIAHPSRPVHVSTQPFLDYPLSDLALEETLEESPLLTAPEDFLVEVAREKPFSVSAILDCSSSMSGDKHLLASIAVAVLLLEVERHNTALTVFASDAQTIKALGSADSPETTVLKFLKSQPRGFTNIAKGLEAGLKQAKKAQHKRAVGLLASDGRTTEGGDPMVVARQFDHLVVLHLHGPGSHLDESKALAQAGHGQCLEVEDFEELPRRIYDAVKILSRY